MGNDDLEGLAKQTDEKIQKALDEAKQDHDTVYKGRLTYLPLYD